MTLEYTATVKERQPYTVAYSIEDLTEMITKERPLS